MSSIESPQPSPELMDALRRGKEELRALRRALPLEEKVRMIILLQGLTLPLIAKRRALKYFERQWPED